MKATSVALVLIVGAAVVLWFGNMLNSWVLGGLAALLLSIPITLSLFSYLSRRHDEQLRAEARAEALEEVALVRSYEYAEEPEEFEADGYMLSPEQELSEVENYRRVPPARQL